MMDKRMRRTSLAWRRIDGLRQSVRLLAGVNWSEQQPIEAEQSA